MSHRHDEPDGPDRTGGERSDNPYQLCPECECPHPLTDTHCSFCNHALFGEPAVAPSEQKGAQIIEFPSQSRFSRIFGRIGTGGAKGSLLPILIGLLLSLVGGWLLVSAVMASRFADFLVGLFFLGYGVYALRSVVRKG